MLRLAYAWGGGAAFIAALAYLAHTYAVTMAAAVPAGTPGSGLRAVLVNSALFALFAAHHSLFARRRVKHRVARLLPHGLVRSTFVWTASLLLTLVCAAWQPVGGALYSHDGTLAWLHGLVVAAGVGLTAVAARRLSALELAGIEPRGPAPPGGHGERLPGPDSAGKRHGARPAGELVASWPYSMVRHPIYLAWFLMVFGASNMTASRFLFACLSSAYLVIAIPMEERLLVHEFGDAYRRYQQRVRWRVVPGLY